MEQVLRAVAVIVGDRGYVVVVPMFELNGLATEVVNRLLQGGRIKAMVCRHVETEIILGLAFSPQTLATPRFGNVSIALRQTKNKMIFHKVVALPR